jgi:hypothetical protein
MKLKTISQYNEEIKALQRSAGDISAKATNENRDPLPEEVSLKEEILDKIEELEKIVRAMEREERITARLEATPAPVTKPRPTEGVRVGDNRAEKDKFQTFGQQMHAVMRAGLPGGTVDPRLYNTRAATGLGESVPSDGGLA